MKETDKCLHIQEIYGMMNEEYERNEQKNIRFFPVLVLTSTNKDHAISGKGKLAQRYMKKLPCLRLNERMPCIYDWPQKIDDDDLLYRINKFR